MLLKLWQRYFLKEILKVFGYFLFCFYALYVLIDYASRASQFHTHHANFGWKDFALYYLCEFSLRADLLIPLGLLVAALYTYSKLNQTNELIALLASGISLHKCLRPFVFVGLFMTALLFANAQYLQPKSFQWMLKIQENYQEAKRKKNELTAVQTLHLADGSLLLYLDYDRKEQLFRDLYWIRNLDHITHMEALNPHADPALGTQVTTFTRDQKGALTIHSQAKQQPLGFLVLPQEMVKNAATVAEERSLTDLWEVISHASSYTTKKDATAAAVFSYKTTLPWLALLAILFPAPFCLRQTRQLPIFLIFSGSIFFLIALYIALGSLEILAKSQLLPPLGTLWAFFSCVFIFVALRLISDVIFHAHWSRVRS